MILPLCRPALAALATLEFTFIYNDFFWALMLIKDGRQAADHVGAEQPPGRSSSPTTTCSPRASLLVAHAHADRVLRAPEAVHQRPDARLDEGLIGDATIGRAPNNR